MSGIRLWGFLVALVLVIGYAVGSGLWVQSSGQWYSSLQRPAWQPPDIVFGLIWPYNFLMLGVAGYLVPQRLSTPGVVAWLLVLAASVASALAWSQQFYVAHDLWVAAGWLIAAAALTLPVVVLAWRASTPLGVLLLPYQVWMITAATLSTAYARLNP